MTVDADLEDVTQVSFARRPIEMPTHVRMLDYGLHPLQ